MQRFQCSSPLKYVILLYSSVIYLVHIFSDQHICSSFIAFYISGRDVKCFWSCSISRRREMFIRFVLFTLVHTVVLGNAFIGGKNISFGGQDLAQLITPISLPMTQVIIAVRDHQHITNCLLPQNLSDRHIQLVLSFATKSEFFQSCSLCRVCTF